MMPVDLPTDLLSRSKEFGARADTYSNRIDQDFALGGATVSGTNLGWDGRIDDATMIITSTPFVFGNFVLGVIGFAFIWAGWTGYGTYETYAIGGGIFSVAMFLAFFQRSAFARRNRIRDELMRYNMTLHLMQEQARNVVRTSFTHAEVQLAAVQAQVSIHEMDLALVAAAGSHLADAASRKSAEEYAQDVRNKQHELTLMEKEQILEEAKSNARIKESSALAKDERKMRRLEHDQALQRAKDDVLIQKQEYDYAMSRLGAEQTHEVRVQSLRELTALRRTLVAYTQQIQHNPALEVEINQAMSAIDALTRHLDRAEVDTPESMRQRELFDEVLTKIVFRRIEGEPSDPSKNYSA